jgi:hypothetical protein
MEATVKHMNLIEHCSAVVLHSEAIKSQGREASRLFTLANEKFREALARAPNSVMTLFHWGKLLHNMALRHFDPSLVRIRPYLDMKIPNLIHEKKNYIAILLLVDLFVLSESNSPRSCYEPETRTDCRD